MGIQLNLYASLTKYNRLGPDKAGKSDKSGQSEKPVLIANFYPGMIISDLIKEYRIPPGEIKIIFINGVHGKPESELHDQDRVAFFPPIGGG